jgi:hypothetical protein
MEMNGHRLIGRISSTLRAKQILVLYAIGLFALDIMAPLVAAWLYRPRPFSEVFAESGAAFYVFIDAPSAVGAVVIAVSLLAIAWLRCGYIRSIVGRRHFGPTTATQFLGMLGVLLITDLVQLGLDGLQRAISQNDWAGMAVGLLQLGLYLFLLYADYAVVISGADPLTALYRSWQTVRANLSASLLILVGTTLLTILIALLIDPRLEGGLGDMIGLFVIRIVALGMVSFVADVSLIMVYIDSVERHAVPAGRRI